MTYYVGILNEHHYLMTVEKGKTASCTQRFFQCSAIFYFRQVFHTRHRHCVKCLRLIVLQNATLREHIPRAIILLPFLRKKNNVCELQQ